MVGTVGPDVLSLAVAGVPYEEIVADYEAHFADGEAAGRTEAEVAAALGDAAPHILGCQDRHDRPPR